MVIGENGLQVVAVGSAMAHNLLLWAGLPPQEPLGKCGKVKKVGQILDTGKNVSYI